MRPSPRLFGLLALVAMTAQPASAGILRKDNVVNYNVTDISDPSVKYEWDKYPVDHPVQNYSLTRGWLPGSSSSSTMLFYDQAGHASTTRVVASNKFGSISVSAYDGGVFGVSAVESELGPGEIPWFSNSTGVPPVSDFNTSGQVVGRIFGVNAAATKLGDPVLDDNIDAALNIKLTSADAIDDMGRIIAQGTHDGKAGTYLLTPVGLPVPAPEPSVLAVLGLGGLALAARAIRRKRAGLGRG